MDYKLKLTPNWEAKFKELHKSKLHDSGQWKRSEAGSSMAKRIKEIYKLSGEAEIVNEIPIKKEGE